MTHAFTLVDVFGVEDFSGNPLAVVHDADDLETEEMLRITRWFHFSETTFLVRPTVHGADYRVRIFTPERELPFAGHPTLGSCHAWMEQQEHSHASPTMNQECGAGLVPVARAGSNLAFAAPPLLRSGPVDEAKIAEVAGVLRIGRDAIVDIAWADNGPGWIAVLLESADAVLALEPERWHASRIDIGVVGPYPDGNPVALELRAFFSDHLGSVMEDPMTGSLNASVAQWLIGTGRLQAPYTASQGTCLGRNGRIEVTQDAEATVWVGGKTRTLFSGQAGF